MGALLDRSLFGDKCLVKAGLPWRRAPLALLVVALLVQDKDLHGVRGRLVARALASLDEDIICAPGWL